MANLLLIRMIKALAVLTLLLLFVHRMVVSQDSIVYALWNDFRIREAGSRRRFFGRSQVSYSIAHQRFFLVHRFQRRTLVLQSAPLDLFVPAPQHALRFTQVLSIQHKRRVIVHYNEAVDAFRVRCANVTYSVSFQEPSAGMGQHKAQRYKDFCVELSSRERFTLSLRDSPGRLTIRQAFRPYMSTLRTIRSKYRLQKFIYMSVKRGHLFFIGIDIHRFHIFTVDKQRKQVHKLGSLRINNSFPLANLLKCSRESNCLNIKLVYNPFDQMFFMFVPFQKLILYRPRKYMFMSDFSGTSLIGLSNMKLSLNRNVLFARIQKQSQLKEPMLELNIIQYDVASRKYKTYHTNLKYVERENKSVSLSRLMTLDHQGLFGKHDVPKLYTDLVVVSREGNDELLCLFF